MGLFGGFLKMAVDVVTLPLSVAEDVLSAGDSGATERKIKDIKEDIDESLDGDLV